MMLIVAHTEIQAVEMSTDHLLFTALDSRAAVYEKLEQLLPALRDAKTMIETKPGMSKVMHSNLFYELLTEYLRRATSEPARSCSCKVRKLWRSKFTSEVCRKSQQGLIKIVK